MHASNRIQIKQICQDNTHEHPSQDGWPIALHSYHAWQFLTHHLAIIKFSCYSHLLNSSTWPSLRSQSLCWMTSFQHRRKLSSSTGWLQKWTSPFLYRFNSLTCDVQITQLFTIGHHQIWLPKNRTAFDKLYIITHTDLMHFQIPVTL